MSFICTLSSKILLCDRKSIIHLLVYRRPACYTTRPSSYLGSVSFSMASRTCCVLNLSIRKPSSSTSCAAILLRSSSSSLVTSRSGRFATVAAPDSEAAGIQATDVLVRRSATDAWTSSIRRSIRLLSSSIAARARGYFSRLFLLL